MLDAPWPPPHDGPHQPRDAHARAWSDDVALGTPPSAGSPWWPADAPGGALPRRVGDEGPWQDGHRPRPGTQGPARAGRLPDATWQPDPAWIPQPSPAPEQRWTPEHDWVAAFERRAPVAVPAPPASRLGRWLVAGAVAAVVVPLAAVALVLRL